MTAAACLRVLVPESVVGPEPIGALVAKFGGAFLETRWQWPRRWGVIAPFAFALADPRCDHLDPQELQALAAELQHKLFGDRGAGEVKLLTLEGSQDDVLRFAVADKALLEEMLAKGGGAIHGRLTGVTPTAVLPMETLDSRPPYPDDAPRLAGAAAADTASVFLPTDVFDGVNRGYRGVYNVRHEVFIGCIVAARPDTRTPLWSPVDGLRDLPSGRTADHDLACLETVRLAAANPGGMLVAPINYSMLVHGATRRAYEPAIAALPLASRPRLAAMIYETPRAPSWSAMKQLKPLLGTHFAFVDLLLSDPQFAIEELSEDSGVNSATLVLPEGDEKARLLAVKRFMGGLESFRKRRIWPCVTNVRTRRELAACVALNVPVLSGKAVTATLRRRPGGMRQPIARLPLRNELSMDPASPEEAGPGQDSSRISSLSASKSIAS
jgi:hypothetical protein